MPAPINSKPMARREALKQAGFETADMKFTTSCAKDRKTIPPPVPDHEKTRIVGAVTKQVIKDQRLAGLEIRQLFSKEAKEVAEKIVKCAKGEEMMTKVQFECGKFILTAIAFSDMPLGDGGKPLGEHSLTELEAYLDSVRDKIHDAAAIPGESEPISN